MDDLVDDVIDIILKSKFDIITCSEIAHRSKTCSNFHYKLVVSLLNNGIVNRFSSENLSVIDALLMNRWLDGQIDCTLDELYTNIIPYGGLNTYYWMKYFKNSKYKVQIVGLEGDPRVKKDTYKYLKFIVSDSFYTGLLNNGILNNGIVNSGNLLPLIKTKTDRCIYDSLSNGKIWNNDPSNINRDLTKRYTFWHTNLERSIKKGKLFSNGFHLSKAKDELYYLSEKNIKLLSFGMASANKQFPCMKITNKFYNEYNVTDKDIIDRPDLFWSKVGEYEATLNMYQVDNWRKLLCFINKYWEPTPLEKKYGNDYNVVKSTKIKNGYFVTNGSVTFPVFPNQKSKYINSLKKTYAVMYAKNYDYIIFVPKSLSVKMSIGK